MKRAGLSFVAFLFLGSVAWAQDGLGVAVEDEPNFFIAVIAGVVLAAAFELLLTNLSLAAGISSVDVPDAVQSSGEGTGEPFEPIKKLRTLTTGVGAFTMVSACIALFAATWLAVELSWTFDLLTGAVLGLVIWGVFYLIMSAFEFTAATTLAGMVVGTATAGLKAVSQAARSVFGSSERRRATDSAEAIAKAVREEILGDTSAKDVRRMLLDFAREIKPEPVDPEAIRDAVVGALEDTEAHLIAKEEDWPYREKEIALKLGSSGLSGKNLQNAARGVSEAFRIVREEYRSPKGTLESAADAALRIAGVAPREAETYRKKVEDFLSRTARSELDPQGIKKDVELLVADPQAGLEAFRYRLSGFDRETVKEALASVTDLAPQKADRILNTIQSAVDAIRKRYEKTLATAQQTKGQVSDKAVAATESAAESAIALRDRVFDKISGVVRTSNAPDEYYGTVETRFRTMLDDPRATTESLMQRLRSIDRESIKEALAHNTSLSHEDAEDLICRLEATRDEALARLERMQDEFQRRMARVRDQAIHQAEEARKTAANAAWWAFATAVVSGGAAVLGGIVAVLVG